MSTIFRLKAGNVHFELVGEEDFVREHVQVFLPGTSAGAVAPSLAPAATPDAGTSPAAQADASDPEVVPLSTWYAEKVGTGASPTMQDSVLIFGYYMKRVLGQHMFSPTDIKRSFGEIRRTVPKSLLQIMGTLKRDHGLLWSPEDRRGVYALAPQGIKHVEKVLGIRDEDREQAAASSAPPAPSVPRTPPAPTPGRRVVPPAQRERAAAAASMAEIKEHPALKKEEDGRPRTTHDRWQSLWLDKGKSRENRA